MRLECMLPTTHQIDGSTGFGTTTGEAELDPRLCSRVWQEMRLRSAVSLGQRTISGWASSVAY